MTSKRNHVIERVRSKSERISVLLADLRGLITDALEMEDGVVKNMSLIWAGTIERHLLKYKDRKVRIDTSLDGVMDEIVDVDTGEILFAIRLCEFDPRTPTKIRFEVLK